MIKFAIASFLLLHVAFSQEIKEEASLKVEGNVRPSISNRFNNVRDRINGFLSDKSVSAKLEAAIERDPALKKRLEGIADTMTAAAQAIETNNAEQLAEITENLKGIGQALAQAGGSFRPSFNAQGASGIRPSFSAQGASGLRPSFGAQGASGIRPSFGAQGASRPSANAQGAINIESSLNAPQASSFNREF